MGVKGKRYSREYKLRAVRMVEEDKRTITSVASELGIGTKAVSGWLRAYRALGPDAFPARGGTTARSGDRRGCRGRYRAGREGEAAVSESAAGFDTQGLPGTES